MATPAILPPRPGRRLAAGIRSSVLAVAVAAVAVAAAGLVPSSLVLAPAGAVVTASGPGAQRVTFGVEPASATGPDGRAHFALAATPGAVLLDHVAVVNFSSTPLTLQLYATDAVETSGGGFGLLPASSHPTGAGSWISLPAADATVTVPPQSGSGPGAVVVPVTVHLPATAGPGDHDGGIVASLQTVGTNATGQRVVLDQRVATRVYVRVSGPLVPRVAVTGLHAAYQGTSDPVGKGTVTVGYVVDNTGNVSLALDQSVSVSGLLGGSGSVRPAPVALLLPGASVAETAVVQGVWPQLVERATVTVRPQAVAGSTAPTPAPVTASTSTWAVPWTLVALIVVVVVAVVTAVWIRRRRRRRGAPAVPPVTVPARPEAVGAGR